MSFLNKNRRSIRVNLILFAMILLSLIVCLAVISLINLKRPAPDAAVEEALNAILQEAKSRAADDPISRKAAELLRWETFGAAEQHGVQAIQRIRIWALDTGMLFSSLGDELQLRLHERAQAAGHFDELYDADGSFREDVLREVYEDLIRERLSHSDGCMTERTAWIESELRNGDWTLVDPEAVRELFVLPTVSDALYAETVSALRYEPLHYRLPDLTSPAPPPDPSRFGESCDPAVIRSLLESPEALRLINGQKLSFSEDLTLLPGSTLRYFLDETILVLVWQEEHRGAVATFSEVFIADGSQLRRKLAGDAFRSGEYEFATELSRQANAVLACSGDYYMINGIQYGVCVYDRELMCSYLPMGDVCYFNDNGDMLFSRGGQFADEDEVRRFLADSSVTFSLSFGPILIENGRDVTPDDYHFGEINEGYARCAIGQLGERHYLSMTLNVAPEHNVYPILRYATEAMLSHGCDKAFALDGGQTGSIILGNELINPVQFGFERETSDIFYFATALY